MTLYNNIPQSTSGGSSSDATVQYFSTFYQKPISLSDQDLAAVTGFFQGAGFSLENARSIATIILSQAKLNNSDAYTIIDTLRKLNGLQLSTIVAEILNTNRFKTSSLGTSNLSTTADEVSRNIIA
jgi:hypothetical protein